MMETSPHLNYLVDEIGDYAIVLHPTKPRSFLTSSVGAHIAQCIAHGLSPESIFASLHEHFELPEDVNLAKDYQTVLEELKAHRLYPLHDETDPSLPTPEQATKVPANLTIYVTEQCNLRCKHCAVVEGVMPKDILTTQDILTTIERYTQLSPKGSISLLGGEPFMHADIVEILKFACQRAPKVTVSTNGSFVTPEIAAQLAELKTLQVQVSLDGADPEVHDFIRGKGSYEKTWRAAETFLAAGIRKNLTIATTLTKSVLQQVKDMVARCDAAEIGTLRFLNLNKMKAALTHWDDIAPKQDDWKQTLRYLLFEVSKRPNPVTRVTASFPGFVPEPVEGVDHWCPIGQTMILDSQKKITNCPSLSTPETTVGDLAKNTFDELVANQQNTQTRKWMLERKDQVEACRVCNWKNYCGGGCTAYMAHQSGSLRSNDEYCEFRRELYREYALRKHGLVST